MIDFEISVVKLVGRVEDKELPSPFSQLMWNADLTSMPKIDLIDTLIYLRTVAKWDDNRMQHWKSDDSYRLFVDGHILGVKWTSLNPDYCYIKVCVSSLGGLLKITNRSYLLLLRQVYVL